MSVHPTPGGTPAKCTAHSPELFVNQKNDTDFQELLSILLTPEGAKVYVPNTVQQANYTAQPAF